MLFYSSCKVMFYSKNLLHFKMLRSRQISMILTEYYKTRMTADHESG